VRIKKISKMFNSTKPEGKIWWKKRRNNNQINLKKKNRIIGKNRYNLITTLNINVQLSNQKI
jgi:hypothetical protein